MFTAEVQNANKGKGELEQAVDKTGQELAEQTAVLSKKFADAEGQNKTLNQEVRSKAGHIKELTNESFERPHGQVTWVRISATRPATSTSAAPMACSGK